MKIHTQLLIALLTLPIAATLHAIPDDRLSAYTTVTGVVGGSVATGLFHAAHASHQKSVGGGLLIGTACGLIGYWFFKSRTATARYNKAHSLLQQLETHQSFVQVPKNDGYHDYVESEVIRFARMIEDAAQLLKKALKDVQDNNNLRDAIIHEQQKIMFYKRKIDHMYAHITYDRVKVSLDEIGGSSLMQDSGDAKNYVDYVQRIYVRESYPLCSAFNTLTTYDDVLKTDKILLNQVLPRAFEGSRLKTTIEEQQQRVGRLKQVVVNNMYSLKQDPAYKDEYIRRENYMLATAKLEIERSQAHAAHAAASAARLKAEAAFSTAQAEHDRNAIELAKLNRPDVYVVTTSTH